MDLEMWRLLGAGWCGLPPSLPPALTEPVYFNFLMGPVVTQQNHLLIHNITSLNPQ